MPPLGSIAARRAGTYPTLDAVPDFVVDHRTHLDVFLRRKGVQQWRVPILASKGGVEVFRGQGGPRVTLKGEGTRLEQDDIVRIVTPVPKACSAALQHEADTNWRDYAIAPGVTPFDKRVRKFLELRTRTILIDTDADPSMANLQGFLKGMATSDKIVHPIRDLVVVGHASGVSGAFKIALTAGAADHVYYEDLVDAVKAKTLNVDMSLFDPRPKGETGVPFVRLLGCAIGRVAPYMKKLKEALGNKIVVVAPNHLLRVASLPPAELAYMAYGFRVFLAPPQTPKGKKRPARTKKDLVAAYVAATDAEAASAKAQSAKAPAGPSTVPGNYVLQDRKPVTKAQWDAWVPKNPEDPKWFPLNPFKPPPKRDPHEIPNLVLLPVLKIKRDAPRVFECRLAHPWFGKPLVLYLKKDPGTDAGRKQAVKAHLQKDVIYTDKHPLPGYVRAGYKTMDEFMDGWDWQFQYDAKTQYLTFNPVRDEYAVVQPITKNGELMMNLYQKKSIPRRLKKLIPIELLQVSDAFYFTQY